MKKYIVVEAKISDINHFEQWCTVKLNDGWQLVGGIAYIKTNDGHSVAQAFQKDNDD